MNGLSARAASKLLALFVVLLTLALPVAAEAFVATEVSQSGSHACAVIDEAAWCWGGAADGQLGNGYRDIQNWNEPTRVIGLTEGVSDVVAAGNASCALQYGAVMCWGRFPGTTYEYDSYEATIPTLIPEFGDEVDALFMSGGVLCAIVDGGLMCMGNGQDGALGNGSAANTNVTVPQYVDGLGPGTGVTDAAIAYGNGCVVVSGSVKCWGNNTWTMFGNIGSPILTPTNVAGLASDVSDVSLSASDLCAIKNSIVHCSGEVNTHPNYDPIPFPSLGTGITDLNGSSWRGCAIATGAVRCWGDQMIGDGGDSWTYRIATVLGIDSGATDVSASIYSDQNACAVQSGAVKCWGRNGIAQLGDWDNDNYLSPVTVDFDHEPPSLSISGAAVSEPGRDLIFQLQFSPDVMELWCSFDGEWFEPCDSIVYLLGATTSQTLYAFAIDYAGNISDAASFSTWVGVLPPPPAVTPTLVRPLLSAKSVKSRKRNKLSLTASFALPAGAPANACAGSSRFTVRSGRKRFSLRATLKPVDQRCMATASTHIPKWFKKKQKLRVGFRFAGNSTLAATSATESVIFTRPK